MFGQLGSNNIQSFPPDQLSTVDNLISGNQSILSISAGGNHTCARIGSNGTGSIVKCWGQNNFGQLGIASSSYSATPVAVSVLGFMDEIRSISAGGNHTCALLGPVGDVGGKQVRCWGNNAFGQLGNGAFVPSSDNVPVTVTNLISTNELNAGRRILSISAGGNHTCALIGMAENGTSRIVKCWGSNSSGQAKPREMVGSYSVPVPAFELNQIVDSPMITTLDEVAAGGSHTCVKGQTGSEKAIVCWGLNSNGQVSGSLPASGSPSTAMPSLVIYQEINFSASTSPNSMVLGWNHSCARNVANEWMCWGSIQK
ncbi:MAG: hypothetical protein KGP28_10740 [Bdellovibrionales bacterium]|nr:hypothetical protein [Bdellovibrionales bacterium]